MVLAHLQQIAVQCPGGAHEEGIKLYEQADVSAKIQTVLQVRYKKYSQTFVICAYMSPFITAIKIQKFYN